MPGEQRCVSVFGGGPGGLMAAEQLAAAGCRVTLHEGSGAVGRKFLLAGRGGLNLTHSEPLEELLARYRPRGGAVEQAIRDFPPSELRAWAHGLGSPTFIGTSGRVFPVGLRANALLDSWLRRLEDLGVEILTGSRFTGWSGDSGAPGADAVVLALGGASWPATGSTGTWAALLRAAGIHVEELRASNSGVDIGWSEHFRARFAGMPVKNVRVGCGGSWARGELMVTEHGLEGGAIYALGPELRQAVDRDALATVTIDLRPDLAADVLLSRLDRRRAKQSLSTVLTRRLGLDPVAVALLRESGGKQLPEDDVGLVALVKQCELAVTALAPIDRAISTAGGIALDEVDDGLMLRRRPGTFVAGEMLDWDAPTGGYLLQGTFSTAVAAARGVVQWLGDQAGGEPGG